MEQENNDDLEKLVEQWVSIAKRGNDETKALFMEKLRELHSYQQLDRFDIIPYETRTGLWTYRLKVRGDYDGGRR